MEKRKSSLRFFFVLIVFLLMGCQSEKTQNGKAGNTFPWQEATLIRDSLDVVIPIQGKLMAWEKMDVLSPINARLVSLLVQSGDKVHTGDLILSLWPVRPYNNYSTIDIKAPLSGVVRAVYWELNDTIPQNKSILTIENRENLILRTSLNKGQMMYLKPDLNVTLVYKEKRIKGAVWKVDKKSQEVTVVVPNQQLQLNRDVYVKGFIHLGVIAGSFMAARYFGYSDSLKGQLKPDSTFTIQKVGIANDSLILIYPDLPNSGEIRVKKILTL